MIVTATAATAATSINDVRAGPAGPAAGLSGLGADSAASPLAMKREGIVHIAVGAGSSLALGLLCKRVACNRRLLHRSGRDGGGVNVNVNPLGQSC